MYMTMKGRLISILLLLLIGAGCAGASAPAPTSSPTADPYFTAQGAGEPRSAGYWLLWNSCAPDNRAETAAANGGREEGWIIMDDLLSDPGILLGELPVVDCPRGMQLLKTQDLEGGDRGDNAAYALARQLLAAQLNLAAGTEYCPAAEGAVQSAQLLLIAVGFDGLGVYANGLSSELAAAIPPITDLLRDFNSGGLCR